MKIPAISKQNPVSNDIKYRRMLNKLNLEVRERMETLEMFYPFETPDKLELLRQLEVWKQGQKDIIFNQCYNPKPTLLQKILKLFR